MPQAQLRHQRYIIYTGAHTLVGRVRIAREAEREPYARQGAELEALEGEAV
jgi:hypothetical protein